MSTMHFAITMEHRADQRRLPWDEEDGNAAEKEVETGDGSGCSPYGPKRAYQEESFARVSGNHFIVNGHPFFANGFNAYWLMDKSYDVYERDKVSSALQQASGYGLTVVRTWAFSDGGGRPLQISPGSYNEDMFKALDFVVSEASKYGLRLILCLVNNWSDYGGKNQYIQWARSNAGHYVNSEDDFFSSDVVKGFYKNNIKVTKN
ncbi:hypothetical protein J5N97_014282 [Dioscorea zingiberensis]|uniref:mannan endo-1,4-beta-mannosidase n=1 Tax=Dioscorea zingiberensis TaxID=325984 RepID=A0A9D5CT64_9LILI|nr:hypothetical protein J5N97_014282 [Dioscorea zingiberensis]